jgi:hypothetical protein
MITDFEMIKKFANEIAREYVSQRCPITDSVLSFCEENQLNPEQIRNLVQLINTLIHMLLFETKTDDKIVEFEPLDPDVLIKKIFSETTPEEELPETSDTINVDLFDDLSSTFRNLQQRLGLAKEKTIDLSDVFGPGIAKVKEETGPNSHKRQLMIMKIQKTAEELQMRNKETAFEYTDVLDSLASKFAMMYGPNLEEFEKDALALRGEKAIPILKDLRICLREPTKEYDQTMIKQARVVDGSTDQMQMLDYLIMLHDEYIATKTAAERLENVLAEL